LSGNEKVERNGNQVTFEAKIYSDGHALCLVTSNEFRLRVGEQKAAGKKRIIQDVTTRGCFKTW
jgi:hypothetical protein